MIKTESAEITVLKHKTISILCNRCGAEMKTECSPNGNGINVHYEAGYDSVEFGDGSVVDFDLCEGCLSQIVEGFKIPASIINRYAWED